MNKDCKLLIFLLVSGIDYNLHVLVNCFQFSLAQRCISARKSSREVCIYYTIFCLKMILLYAAKTLPSYKQSNHYATMSDAINKLNFNQALYDSNCYPFICQVRRYPLIQSSS